MAATHLSAQVHVVGRVIENETGEPIVGVDVTVRGPHGAYLAHRITDQRGMFEYFAQRATGIRFVAERIGYKRNTTPVLLFDQHDFFRVEVRLDRKAVLLAPLEVVARSGLRESAVLANFRARLKHGHGLFITREEVEQRNPSHVTDMLAELPGVRLQSSGKGLRRVVRMARTASTNCPTQIWVDGFLINPQQARPLGGVDDYTIDDIVQPQDVEGIEVYSGLSSVPPAFLNRWARCGVVAIWTRHGGQ
ncbi:MAG TPA: TonB-dependent receptor plug domain-containing protein [Longimicrobiales bacterium]|nr:TonB-dependent receptor plug domain-containing protein [Longimicrobiales bacterium]